jgi:hypothetical protein
MLSVANSGPPKTRHPELVSGSIVRHARLVAADKWTLKQVQGDDAALVG